MPLLKGHIYARVAGGLPVLRKTEEGFYRNGHSKDSLHLGVKEQALRMLAINDARAELNKISLDSNETFESARK